MSCEVVNKFTCDNCQFVSHAPKDVEGLPQGWIQMESCYSRIHLCPSCANGVTISSPREHSGLGASQDWWKPALMHGIVPYKNEKQKADLIKEVHKYARSGLK